MESREQRGVLESMLLGPCMTSSLPPGSLCSWASVQTQEWLRTEVGWQLLAEVLITQLSIPHFCRGWCLMGIHGSMQRFSHLAHPPPRSIHRPLLETFLSFIFQFCSFQGPDKSASPWPQPRSLRWLFPLSHRGWSRVPWRSPYHYLSGPPLREVIVYQQSSLGS